MARIKITGYLHVEDLPADLIDLEHETGLSNDGFEALSGASGHDAGRIPISNLTEIEFAREDED